MIVIDFYFVFFITSDFAVILSIWQLFVLLSQQIKGNDFLSLLYTMLYMIYDYLGISCSNIHHINYITWWTQGHPAKQISVLEITTLIL